MTARTANVAKLGAYLNRVQTEATALESIIEGIEILLEDDRGRNAAQALISIALEKAALINAALDGVNWPKAVGEGGV